MAYYKKPAAPSSRYEETFKMRLPKFLSRATVADELGISIKTVDRWIERGLIPAKRPPGTRRVMIPENALAELLSQAKWDVR